MPPTDPDSVAAVAKIVSLSQAVSELVHDGATVACEGITHLIPFAAAHEIIRQRRRELTLVRMAPDLIYDQMIGAGCAAKVVFSWAGNPGTCPGTPAPSRRSPARSPVRSSPRSPR